MLLGETLLRLGQSCVSDGDELRREVIGHFSDIPESRYSIHRISMSGESFDKRVGDWIGPNCMAQIIRMLAPTQLMPSLSVHVVMDSTLYIPDVEVIASGYWKPLLLCVPLRLGLDAINPGYVAGIKRIFELPQSVGAMGGRPNSAFFFFGVQEDRLLYLDPHTTQYSEGIISENTPLDSYSYNPQAHSGFDSIEILEVDPSLCLGFFCSTKSDFDEIIAHVEQIESLNDGSRALFSIIKDKPMERSLTEDYAVSDDGSEEYESGGRKHGSSDDDGFELVDWG